MESLFNHLQEMLPDKYQVEIIEHGWIWFLIGIMGLVTFSARFIIQWIASERKRESVIPLAFWYLSIVGSVLLLSYAFHRGDPVFILSYLFNCLIYFRNLHLIFLKKKRWEAS